jgi:hypothetical protein
VSEKIEMKIAIADLRSNPFRNLTRLPLNPEKVEALAHSIKDTSFWDNLLGRKTANGVEIAYGHHRIAALKKCGIKTIDLVVRPLTDTEMVKIMAHENMDEWGHSADLSIETVRATLEAAAAGQIELPKLKDGGQTRKVVTPRGATPYSADTIAKFLGWKAYKVETALGVIEAEAEGVIDSETVQELSTKQAQVLTQQVRRVAKETGDKRQAKQVGRTLAKRMRGHQTTIHTAKRDTDLMTGKMKALPKSAPDINRFAHDLSGEILNMLANKNRQKLEAICKHREHLDPERKRELRRALDGLIRVATKFREELA